MLDGNEAAARIAHLTSEVIAIYPITPSSTMGELADAWSAAGQKNIWGMVPEVIEMQSEAGAAGAVHGSLQAGALTTTFTASQGLLLMLPNMFKIAGELTPAVFHIAARTLATHALSIFGDHSDVMAARTTGFALLASASVQEAQDMAMIAHMSTLKARVPFLHFFDGFRTSHEVNKIDLLFEEDVRALIDEDLVVAHRARALNPDQPGAARHGAEPGRVLPGARGLQPVLHGGARHRAASRWTASPSSPAAATACSSTAAPPTPSACWCRWARASAPRARRSRKLVGRRREGRPRHGAAVPAVRHAGLRRGAAEDACARSPCSTAPRSRAPSASRCTRTWSPRWSRRGREGTPMPRVIGGRYGLSSKEYTPAMAKAALDELRAAAAEAPFHGRHRRRRHAPVADSGTTASTPKPRGVTRAVFYGLGADGTVGATKNTVKIIGENTPLHAQGYFVYDSKKSGAITVSHLRFGPKPIESTYLIRQADFVACHQFEFMEKLDVLALARPGATFLLNSPYGPDEVWDKLPREAQETDPRRRSCKFYVVDALAVAKQAGLAGRINTVTQACFFAISGILPRDEAIAKIKDVDPQDLRQARRDRAHPQLRRGRRVARRAARGDGARAAPTRR